MLEFTLKQIKVNFFTPAALAHALDREEQRRLGQLGGYVRKVARNSLKYGETSAPSGQPPVIHRGKFHFQKTDRKTGVVSRPSVSPLRELLFFAQDPTTKSVVVGPMLFRGTGKHVKTSGPVPATLEKGGTVRVERDVFVGGRKATPRQRDAFLRLLKEGRITRERTPTVKVTSKQYAPHPFMGPALQRSLPKFSAYFANLTTPGSGGVSSG